MVQTDIIKQTMVGTALFNKYPESHKDVNLIFPFADSNQPPEVIEAETARAFITGLATGASVVVQSSLWSGQIGYMASTFGLENNLQVHTFDPNVPNSHIGVLNSLQDKSVHVLHPYDLINPSKYLVTPEILFLLNDKKHLGKITTHAPKRKVISLENILVSQGWFQNELESLFGEVPQTIVVKKGDPSAAGDGVYVGQLPFDIKTFAAGQKNLIIEQFIQTSASFNVQYFIDKAGQYHFLGYGKQQIGEHGEYDGTTCFLAKTPHLNLSQAGVEATAKVAKFGYIGFCGFDILEELGTNSNYVVDANVRINASTAPYLLKDQLMKLLGNYVHVGSASVSAQSEVKAIDAIEKHGGMLYSISSRYGNSQYKCFVFFGGNSEAKALQNYNDFKEAIK